jgi:outer membrane lipoprotein-sorting protein
MEMAKLASLAIITFLALAVGQPQEELPTVDEILQQLDTASDSLKSFSANFEQVEKDEFGDETVTRGDAFFLSPGRMLFVSYINGKKYEEMGKNTENAWRVRHKIGTVDKFKVDDKEKVSEGLSITDAEDLQENYDLELKGVRELTSGKAYYVVGIAKESRRIIKVEIWINVENPAPVCKAISHQKRIVTSFTLKNIQRDIDLDPNLFKYEVPKGFEEITH